MFNQYQSYEIEKSIRENERREIERRREQIERKPAHPDHDRKERV